MLSTTTHERIVLVPVEATVTHNNTHNNNYSAHLNNTNTWELGHLYEQLIWDSLTFDLVIGRLSDILESFSRVIINSTMQGKKFWCAEI